MNINAPAYLNNKTGTLHRDAMRNDACRKSALKKGNAESFTTVAEGRKAPKYRRDCQRCLRG